VEARTVVAFAAKELRDARRNRWFLLYTAALAALSLAISGLAVSEQGAYGMAGFGRTTASLVNLIMLVVPLMGLTLGAQSLAAERERGTLLYVFAQPVTPGEVFVGKFLGLSLALLASLALGFGLSGLVISWRVGGAHVSSYLTLCSLSVGLSLASLGIGFLISAATRRASTAVGVAIFVWLVVVLLGDLGLMGTALVLRLDVDTLFGLALGNPLQVFKIAAIAGSHGTVEVLGPAGIYAYRTFGAGLLPLLVAVLVAWVVAPMLSGLCVFRWRGAL
jgi:Cu-processing system permease protein